MQIAPAKKRFFDEQRFARGVLKVGETFSVDSGMGGSWTVAFVGYTDGGYLRFERDARPDWPLQAFTFQTPADAAKEIFILVPENPNFA